MAEYNNFPKPENDIVTEKQFKHRMSKAFADDQIYIFFKHSRARYCRYRIASLHNYLLNVRTNRLLSLGVDDILGYEINGRAVHLQDAGNVPELSVSIKKKFNIL